ncbi:hypothetical protein HOP50_06g42420 [Chloropicon primus]|uniref:ditrans,polycis-polyprenyl diphosphate synthase [(2E,6E)-farnesyldiphosphate specific] n=2 Tax=Chloropicon primus TaxID=1764295 RepID=A0A5B8MQP5_9CHLO|nr:hypothetical protein A3770_06p42180 [Chloropicon primus]UPR00921.1 hypothetical protein HOP50_06g42420 [Chloropicon primus]|eukprot:QDZ21700.1 hypothetical protein A3770_06p42180 [Chloropicon primus]
MEKAAAWAGRLALRMVVWVMLTARTATDSAGEICSTYWAASSEGRGHKGSKPKDLRVVGLVVGSTAPSSRGGAGGTDERGLTWEKAVPAVCRTTRYLNERGVGTVLIYDGQGVLKSQWGERELRKGLFGQGDREAPGGEGDAGADAPAGPSLCCTVKLLCEQDWESCVSGAVKSLGTLGNGERAEGRHLESFVESHPVKEVCASSAASTGALGKPPDLILCFSPRGEAFSLSGFFPWHTRCAEIYKIPLGLEESALVGQLNRVLEKYFDTKQRFGT